jgi:hypothetical protein
MKTRPQAAAEMGLSARGAQTRGAAPFESLSITPADATTAAIGSTLCVRRASILLMTMTGPLMIMTGARVSHLYDLMDAAATPPHSASRCSGHAPA